MTSDDFRETDRQQPPRKRAGDEAGVKEDELGSGVGKACSPCDKSLAQSGRDDQLRADGLRRDL